MPFAIIALTAGGVLIVAALTNHTVGEVLRGAAAGVGLGPTKDFTSPKTVATGDMSGPGRDVDPTGSTGQFKGPNAMKLEALRKVLTGKYRLHVSQICRPANATYGAPNSRHKSCRAMDLTGTVADRVAAAKYCKSLPWVAEVFCDQAGMVAPGYDHSDHLHVGA